MRIHYDSNGIGNGTTEHLRLFILETQREQTFKARAKISVNNLDIFAYVNSKFMYIKKKHIKTQLTKLYTNIMEQKCALEKQIQNVLSLSNIISDEMAFRIMKNQVTTVMAGEVIL